MACCSERGGRGISDLASKQCSMLSTVAPCFVHSLSKNAWLPSINPCRYSLSMIPCLGRSAFISWLSAIGTILIATGIVRERIPLLTTKSTAPGATTLAALAVTASLEMWSVVSSSRERAISFGDTQGIDPLQNEALAFDGVPPPVKDTVYFSRRIVQCSGTLPSHSTPESL